MKKLLKTILFVTAITSGSALADCSGNNCIGTITRLFITSTGNVSVRTSGDESQLNCDAGTGSYLTLDKNHPGFNPIYSLLLTAHTTEQQIWIRTGGTDSCFVSYVVWDK